ncbi:fimbrial protein [Achromobacter deleyi]|nr:fimbrial protein [Achromobacter deleyi]
MQNRRADAIAKPMAARPLPARATYIFRGGNRHRAAFPFFKSQYIMFKRNTTRIRRPRRGALAAAGWIIACLLPLPAHAAGPGCQLDPTRAGNYIEDKGIQAAPGQFAPALLTLDKSNPPGTVVYDAPMPPVPWVCVSNSTTRTPFLVPGANLTPVINELRKAGLKLVLQINGYPDWEPTGNTTDDRFPLSQESYAPKSATDSTLTANGLLLGRLRLVTVTPPTRPVRAYFPPYADLVRIHYGFIHTNHIEIGSNNATAISLVPTCIAKISTPDSVYLGRAYRASNLPLPAPQQFTIVADFDTACDGGFNVLDLGSMVVPLRIKFEPEGNTALTSLGLGIELKNTDGAPNGLALQIKQNGVTPITFNAWHDSESLTTSLHPRNLSYSAELVKTGTTLVSGAFRQQVTILVTFQ